MLKTLVSVSDTKLRRMVFNEASIRKLESVSQVDWVPENEPYTEKDLIRDIGEYDVYITCWGSPKVTPAVLEKAHKLKFVGHAAGSVFNSIEPCVYNRGITVVNANYHLAKSTAEGAMAFMMAGAWNLKGYSSQLIQGRWSVNAHETVMGINGQTIGLIGLGDISREMIRLLSPYDVRILMYSNHCSREESRRLGIECCSLDELLTTSTIISLHNTLTPDSVGMLGKAELDLIQDGALFINTARAPIVNESAFVELMQKGRVSAVLDVYWNEPLGKEHPLLALPNVYCLPHICGFSSYWKTRLGESVVDELTRWVHNQPLQCAIDKDKI